MVYRLRAGNHYYDIHEQTLVMGILNVTPDSFSDGGKYEEIDQALQHAKQMEQDGAHIIDVGGESTRPGHEPVSAEEEIKRVIPVIEQIKDEVSIPVSIDTYKAETALQAIRAGAHIINDVWGAKKDPEIADVAAEYDVPIVLMHNRDHTDYDDLLEDIKKDLEESITIAKKRGVKDDQIILDPGIGFGKTMEHNLYIMRRLEELTVLGYPLLLGTSRKRFIGHVLDLPVHERVEGTGASVCLGIQKGASIVRVHDVKEMARMAKMMDAMLGKRGSALDKIFINGMKFYGYHGVFPEENRLGQTFIVDVTLEVDLIPAGNSDDIKDSVDYGEVYEWTRQVVEGSARNLIETVAEDLAALLFRKYEAIQRVKIKVTKPNPPIPGNYEGVGVEICRER